MTSLRNRFLTFVAAGLLSIGLGASAALKEALEGFQRQALHAARLSFTHPRSGKAVSYEAPLPADFAALLKALTRDAREAGE